MCQVNIQSRVYRAEIVFLWRSQRKPGCASQKISSPFIYKDCLLGVFPCLLFVVRTCQALTLSGGRRILILSAPERNQSSSKMQPARVCAYSYFFWRSRRAMLWW